MRRTTLARLAILLAVGALAGCGTDDGDRSGRGASSTTAASSGSSPSGSATAPTAPPSDLPTETASTNVPPGQYAASCTSAEASHDIGRTAYRAGGVHYGQVTVLAETIQKK